MYKNQINNKLGFYFLFISFFLLMIVNPTVLHAQDNNQKSSQNVVQDLHGNPISNVNVLIKGTSKSVQTSDNGIFVLDFKSGDVLIFTHKDFLINESTMSERDQKKGVLIRMQDKLVKSSTLIPHPYSEERDSESYIGSASTVYSDKLTSMMGTTIIPALQARIAGLNIFQVRGARERHTSANYSGSLGGDVPVFGRGLYSDNSEFAISSRGLAPVVVIDGVQREFYAIDPDVIESVSLQKDALSSMFLGMQSSRGALIVTTKEPTKGPLQVSFTGKMGVNSPVIMPKPLNSYQYAYLLNEALENDGKLPFYSNEDFAKFRLEDNPYTHPNVNWYDELFNENSVSQYYNLNVSGGNNVAQYFVGLGYTSEEGLFKTSNDNPYNTNLNYQRYMITSKVNVNVTSDFTANILLIGRIESGNQPGGTGTGYNDLLNAIYSTPNSAYPVKNKNNSWGGNISFTNNLMSQTLNSGYLLDNSRDVLGTINLNYDFSKIVKGLSASAKGSITTQTRSYTDRTKRSAVYAFKEDDFGQPVYTMYSTPTPQVSKFYSVGNYQSMYGQFAVNYKRLFDNHSVQAGVKADTRTVLNNYDLPEIPSNIIADLSYDYAKKYFIQASIAESYYNRYAPGKRWGNFQAVGVGWYVSNENFMDEIDFVDKFKLRAVYGNTGNGVSNSGYYLWSQTYSYHGAAWYSLGSSQSSGHFTTENFPLANPNITWEKAHKVNLGVDISMLKDRLQFTVDYYNDNYHDLLQNRGKNIELMGAQYPPENIGKILRTGVELTAIYQNRIGSFNYYVSANWNIENSKVLFIDEQEMPHDYLYRTGRPQGVMFGLMSDGFLTAEDITAGYPVMQGFTDIQPGDIKYIDKNEDGVIDEFDASIIGGDKPLSFFGVDLGVEYKGFELSMLLQGVYNRDIYLGNRDFTEGFMSNNQHFGQAYEHLLNRWTPENAENATFPRLSAGGNNYNQGNGWGSSFWVKSGNFIRLKSINVAYTLPQSFSKNYLGNMRVKVFATGQNLFTLSAYSLLDPEVQFTEYPIQKNINFGVNVKF
ncbi:MAG: SusC/RagA family TonB-linked outer membrane protein [Bacteroidales bacterium 36-12]|nr:MAG: SusC/RagA family TonB-linked outer membrane protein [Bacteroidales bacterium 36-12]